MANAVRSIPATTRRRGNAIVASSSRSSVPIRARPASKWPAPPAASSFLANPPRIENDQPMSRELFADVVRETVLSLPQDMKAVLRIVEDPEVDDESRVAAAGALLHVLSSQNAIPGLRGLLAWVDDALVMRLVLERIEKKSPAAMAKHKRESPELLEPMPDQMKTARKYLGELMGVLERAAD